MAIFAYKARTKDGEERSGVIETSSKEAALDTLQQRELFILSLHEQRKKSLFEFEIGGGRVKLRDLVIFSRQLSILFEAHIPVIDALRTMGKETRSPVLRKATDAIIADVSGGLLLSQALAKHPKIFSSLYVNLMRSGEESGKLREVVLYLADYLERTHTLVNKTRNALIYPGFILTAFIGVIIVLAVVVMPRLSELFVDFGQEIPLFTRIIISGSLFIRRWLLMIVVLLILGVIALWRWGQTPPGKLFYHRLQLNIPLAGELFRKLHMARIMDNLQMLLSGGIPALRALTITRDMVTNVVYKEAMTFAIDSVKGGGAISVGLERSPEVPPLAIQMIRVGETSGKLDFILEKIARFYQREVESLVDNLVTLIEPALILVLGGGVAFVVLSVLGPIYNLVGTF